MVNRLANIIRRDAQRFVTKLGTSVDIVLTTPDGLTTVETSGYFSDHHKVFDTEGNQINANTAHINLSEKALIELSYPYRNSRDQISLIKHTVSVSDVRGRNTVFTVRENHPDKFLGVIVCILGVN